MTVWTIGHSTRRYDEFLRLLQVNAIVQLADVRSFPGSRRYPHFSRESLERQLEASGVTYRHFPALGGRREPRPDSPNVGWRNRRFRGYADHMQTDAFAEAMDDLLGFARVGRTAVMCAEVVWWRCHRGLLADALCARGVTVEHILSPTAAPQRHQLCDFARINGPTITYVEDTRVFRGGRGNRTGSRPV